MTDYGDGLIEPRLPVPDVGIFDDPQISVCINVQWAAYLDGALQRLLRRSYWEGDRMAQQAAVDEVTKFIVALMARTPCGDEELDMAQLTAEVTITHTSTFPLLLKSLVAGETIDEILVTVDAAFDGSVLLTVGDAADNARLMTAVQNDLALVDGQFQVSPQYRYDAATDIFVYLTGTSTTGNIRITVYSYL